MGSYDLTEKIELFTELSYSRTKSDVYLAATPVTATGAVNVIPANNPYNPFGEPVNFSWRPLDVGPRTDFITTHSSRYLLGLKGEVMDNWNWEIGLMLNSDSVADIGVNYIVTTDVIAAASGTFARAPGIFLNVFGDKQGNDPRLLAALNNTVTTNGELTQRSLDGKVTGELFDLPAGPLGIAIGGEQRFEKLEVFLDPLTQQGAFAGSGTRQNTFGRRTVSSGYAEINVPLASSKQNIPFVRSAELQIAARTESYDITGATASAKFDSTKPKVAISYRPIKDLMIRASYAEGFRAPSLSSQATTTRSVARTRSRSRMRPRSPRCVIGFRPPPRVRRPSPWPAPAWRPTTTSRSSRPSRVTRRSSPRTPSPSMPVSSTTFRWSRA
jgi:iron complex outermembrane receptor protein